MNIRTHLDSAQHTASRCVITTLVSGIVLAAAVLAPIRANADSSNGYWVFEGVQRTSESESVSGDASVGQNNAETIYAGAYAGFAPSIDSGPAHATQTAAYEAVFVWHQTSGTTIDNLLFHYNENSYGSAEVQTGAEECTASASSQGWKTSGHTNGASSYSDQKGYEEEIGIIDTHDSESVTVTATSSASKATPIDPTLRKEHVKFSAGADGATTGAFGVGPLSQ